MEKRLLRSRTDRMIWGVCGGLGEYFDIDPVFVRVSFVALAFLHGVGILAYIVLALVVPQQGRETVGTSDVVKQNLEDMGDSVNEFGEDLRQKFAQPDYRERRERGRNLLAAFLVLLGIVFLLNNLGLFWWLNFNVFWPIILIIIGLLLLFGWTRR